MSLKWILLVEGAFFGLAVGVVLGVGYADFHHRQQGPTPAEVASIRAALEAQHVAAAEAFEATQLERLDQEFAITWIDLGNGAAHPRQIEAFSAGTMLLQHVLWAERKQLGALDRVQRGPAIPTDDGRTRVAWLFRGSVDGRDLLMHAYHDVAPQQSNDPPWRVTYVAIGGKVRKRYAEPLPGLSTAPRS